MLAFAKRNAAFLAIGALSLWWLTTGDIPVVDYLAHVAKRGQRLTWPTVDSNGNVVESLDHLVGQAVGTLGRELDRDAVMLGIISASEHATASRREKAAIQRVCMNDAAAHGWSIEYTATSGKGLGKQLGRRYASRGAMYEEDLAIAEANLAGTIDDETRGATHFVHITGFANFGEYQRICDKWYKEAKIVPVALDGIKSFRIFLPESQVASV